MRTASRGRDGRNQGASAMILESCPKCGNPTMYLEPRDNSMRCRNMICGYRGVSRNPRHPRRNNPVSE